MHKDLLSKMFLDENLLNQQFFDKNFELDQNIFIQNIFDQIFFGQYFVCFGANQPKVNVNNYFAKFCIKYMFSKFITFSILLLSNFFFLQLRESPSKPPLEGGTRKKYPHDCLWPPFLYQNPVKLPNIIVCKRNKTKKYQE